MTSRRWLPALLVAAAALAAYANAPRNGFVWDDHTYVEGNPFVQDPGNLRLLLSPRYYTGTHEVLSGQRPVFLASLLLDRALWGGAAAGYHATSVAVHAANSAAVYGLGLAWGLPPSASLWAGLLFAVHPVQTEAVDAISFRAEPLASLLLLCALGAYLAARRGARPAAPAWLAASAALFALALLSKESAVVLPLLAALAELYFPARPGRRARLGAALAAYLLVLLAFAGFWAPRFRYRGMDSTPLRAALDKAAASLPTAPGPGTLELGLPPGKLHAPAAWEYADLRADRRSWLLTMIRTFGGYFRLLLLPWPLLADRAPLVAKSWGEPGVWAGLAALAAAAAWAAQMRRRDPVSAFGAAWLLAALLPAWNLLPLYSPMAERYLYLGVAGAAWAAASALARLAPRARAAVGALLVAALLPATWARNSDWRSDESLFLSAPADAPLSSMARVNRGEVLRRAGRHAEAEREYAEATRLRPAYPEAWLGLGAAREGAGDPAGAREAFEKARALAPESGVAALAFALHLARAGERVRALELYRTALRLQPSFSGDPAVAPALRALERLR